MSIFFRIFSISEYCNKNLRFKISSAGALELAPKNPQKKKKKEDQDEFHIYIITFSRQRIAETQLMIKGKIGATAAKQKLSSTFLTFSTATKKFGEVTSLSDNTSRAVDKTSESHHMHSGEKTFATFTLTEFASRRQARRRTPAMSFWVSSRYSCPRNCRTKNRTSYYYIARRKQPSKGEKKKKKADDCTQTPWLVGW